MTDEELHAYLDGELPPERARGVADALRANPALARRAAAFEADKQRLAEAFADLALAPLPRAWVHQIQAASAPRRRRGLRPAGIALAAAAAAIALLIVATSPQSDPIVTEALAIHRHRLAAETTVALAALPAPDRWLRDTLHLAVKVPDLHAAGFRLAALSVYGDGADRQVALRYQDAAGRALTLIVGPSNGQARFDIISRDGVRICVWQDDEIRTVMTASMQAGEMMRLASLAYRQINL